MFEALKLDWKGEIENLEALTEIGRLFEGHKSF